MKAKVYLLLVLILAAFLIAVFLPIIASSAWAEKFYDPDLIIPRARDDLLTSAFGLNWPSNFASRTPSAPYTATALPTATIATATPITSPTAAFSLNFTPVVTPTPYPRRSPTATREPRDRPTDIPSPGPTDSLPTNPPATDVRPTNPPTTDPPPTSVPPTDPPPTNQPILPPILSTIIPFP